MPKTFGPLAQLAAVSAMSSAYNFAYTAGVVSASALADGALGFASFFYLFGWLDTEAARFRYRPSHGYILWMLVLAPLLLPHFVFRTRGIRGVPIAILVECIVFSPLVAYLAGELAFPHVPEVLWAPEK